MLSERLRNMRFMRQVDETDLRSKLEDEQKEREKATHWTLETDETDEQDGKPIVIVEEAYTIPTSVACTGRQSFGKFNIVVEKRNRGSAAIKTKSEKKEENMRVKHGGEDDGDEGDDGGMSSNPAVDHVGFKPPLAKKKVVMDFRKLATGKRSFNPTPAPPGPGRKKARFQHQGNKR